MKQNIIDTIKQDELLLRLCERIASSDRMRAAALSIVDRVSMLDSLDSAGFKVNNAIVTIVFDGGQVTSTVNPDNNVQIKGGGFVPLPRAKKGVS